MQLKKSCCCYSLQHGAVIIGITVMVSSAVALLTEVGMIAEWEDIRESLKNPRMQEFVLPVLIISTVFSSVYVAFSVLLLQGIKEENRLYMIPWISWSVMYILFAASGCIYELTLGGTPIELSLPPVLYILIIGSWTYAVMSIIAYFRTLPPYRTAKSSNRISLNVDEHTAPLIGLTNIKYPIPYPKPVWEDDSSSFSNFSDSRRQSLVKNNHVKIKVEQYY